MVYYFSGLDIRFQGVVKMTQAAKILYTVEEYFAQEEKAEYKSEYYHGEIIPMPGVKLNHDRIAGNTYRFLGNVFEEENRNCEAYTSDVKVKVVEGKDYTYPDLMALCGELKLYQRRKDTITNPQVIFEVLSKSTRNYDRAGKFERYKAIETLQNYVLIDQYKVYAECHVKQADATWQKYSYTKMEETLKLPAISVEIPLSRIYYRISFEKP
jgi:Uma2 family endonuclease